MEKLRNYDISFSSLKLGSHSFEFDIEYGFFDLFDFEQEFNNPKIEVLVNLIKHSSFLELNIKTSGNVTLACDISEEEYTQPIENSIKILVKFGEEFDDSNEEVLIIPIGSHSVNVAQLIFESILLSIPMKHVHPKYLNGHEDEYTELIKKYNLPSEEEE